MMGVVGGALVTIEGARVAARAEPIALPEALDRVFVDPTVSRGQACDAGFRDRSLNPGRGLHRSRARCALPTNSPPSLAASANEAAT